MSQAPKCLSDKIQFYQMELLPSEIQSYSFNIENSLFSTIKLNSPLQEVINEKYFGTKRSFPHKLFYTKLFAFFYVSDATIINLEKFQYKAFPQTNFDVKFLGKTINISSNGYMSFKNDERDSHLNLLYSNYINSDIKYYKLSINKIKYLLIVETNNIEIDGVLKAKESFDLVKTFKSKLLYISNKNTKINFMNIGNNNFDFNIKKDSILIFDIKSAYSVYDLMRQITAHDAILFNLYKSCNEDINQYYYIFIITDKDKTQEKEDKLKKFLDSIKINLNVAIIQTEESKICGKDFSVVIDKEFLAKNIIDEISELKNNIKIINQRQEKIESRLDGIEETQDNIKIKLNEIEETQIKIESDISDLKSKIESENKQEMEDFKKCLITEIRGIIREEIRNNNNSEGLLSSIKRFFGY